MNNDFYSGSADIMESVKDFSRTYSVWILGIAIVLLIIVVWKMYSPKKEGMYQPGATAWLTESIARMENFNIPSADKCASIDTSQLALSGSDAYRQWLAPKMAGDDSSFEYAYDPDKENMTDAKLAYGMFN
jgi:hypothetical protein